MGNRYGRQKKRRHCREMAELKLKLSNETSLNASLKQDYRRIQSDFEEYDRIVMGIERKTIMRKPELMNTNRDGLLEYFKVAQQPNLDSSIPISHQMSAPPRPEYLREILLRRVRALSRHSREEAGRYLHLEAGNGVQVGYFMSDEAVPFMTVNQIARLFAEHLRDLPNE